MNPQAQCGFPVAYCVMLRLQMYVMTIGVLAPYRGLGLGDSLSCCT